jgi:hypothetical protein
MQNALRLAGRVEPEAKGKIMFNKQEEKNIQSTKQMMSRRPTNVVPVSKAHYTHFGATAKPREADIEGFLHFRACFRELPRSSWTAAEEWIAGQNAAFAKEEADAD